MENVVCALSSLFPSPSFQNNFTSCTQLQKDIHLRAKRYAAERSYSVREERQLFVNLSQSVHFTLQQQLVKICTGHGTLMGKWYLLLNQSKNTLGQTFLRNYSDHFQRYNSGLTLADSYFSDRTKGRAGIIVATIFNSSSCSNLGRLGRYYCHCVSFPACSQLSAKYFALKCEKKEMYSWTHRQHRYNTKPMTSEAYSKLNMQSDKPSRLWWALGTPQKTLLQKRHL